MKNITKIYLGIVLSFFMMVTAQENIAISGAVSSSITVSTERSETVDAYYLEINIAGIAPQRISLQISGQNLILEAKQGNISSYAIAGGQYLHYSFSYRGDANLRRLSRKDSINKIIIKIPKQ